MTFAPTDASPQLDEVRVRDVFEGVWGRQDEWAPPGVPELVACRRLGAGN
ncbi:MAG TPA: hypothetical protein VGG17_11330 [Acidimicrobiales bacterium]|jgi:hypothetical protein